MHMEFEWDSGKEQLNVQKHGISFHEGATVFGDALAWTFPDPDHSEYEERFLTIGQSLNGRILVISHTERNPKTRIISVRKATPRERRYYEKRQ